MKSLVGLILLLFLANSPSISARDPLYILFDDYTGELRSIQVLRPSTIDVYKDNSTKRKFVISDDCKITTTNKTECTLKDLKRGDVLSVHFTRDARNRDDCVALSIKVTESAAIPSAQRR